MSCCDNGSCGKLPAAGLDGVAAQIKKQFEEATQPSEEEERVVIPVAKTISQETFDEVVQENVEEFDMTVEEAFKDAVEQFHNQGVYLDSLSTTVELKDSSAKIKILFQQFDELLKDPAVGNETIGTSMQELLSQVSRSHPERVGAGKDGAVGAASYVCKKYMDDVNLVVGGLNLLEELFKSFENKEILPLLGAEAIVEALQTYPDNARVQIACFATVMQACAKYEPNKRTFKELEINPRLVYCLKHPSSNDAFVSACKFLRIYLSDDDRRPGIHPGTFLRARELGENYNIGVVKPLVDFLSQEEILGDIDLVRMGLSTLKVVAVNDLICKHIANKGALTQSLMCFEAHISDENIAVTSCSLLKTVARNDDIKRIVGKGAGLGLVLRALEEHHTSWRVAEQALACLSSLCLRQPENCELIAGLGCLPMIASSMGTHPDIASVQRCGISTFRNMVSSWQNKDLCILILDEGAERLIRDARVKHSICDEVAYAALRDLGLPYEM